MSSCAHCGASVAADARNCPECGARVVFRHVPHPRIATRRAHAIRRRDLLPHESALQRWNSWFAVRITGAVGTMWCAYLFALLALVSLPDALRAGTGPLVSWVAQTFLQLVLLSIIIVGQKVDGAAADKRANDTYEDAEALLHESQQLQRHLAAQDQVLAELGERLRRLGPA